MGENPEKKTSYLTKQEKKNPIGMLANGMSDKQIIEKLKEIDFLTEDLKITRRGREYVLGKLESMDNVEMLMIERFIIEHHELEANIEYND